MLFNGFIGAIFQATRALQEVVLTARTEHIAATALVNAILTIALAVLSFTVYTSCSFIQVAMLRSALILHGSSAFLCEPLGSSRCIPTELLAEATTIPRWASRH
jgi:hypothetical protein